MINRYVHLALWGAGVRVSFETVTVFLGGPYHILSYMFKSI